jgi:hypothetical protein
MKLDGDFSFASGRLTGSRFRAEKIPDLSRKLSPRQFDLERDSVQSMHLKAFFLVET